MVLIRMSGQYKCQNLSLPVTVCSKQEQDDGSTEAIRAGIGKVALSNTAIRVIVRLLVVTWQNDRWSNL